MTGTVEHWNRWQAERARAPSAWVDWGDHPRVLSHLQRELFGDAGTTVFEHWRAAYPHWAQARALSLCSGDGSFERLLVEHGVFGSVLGIDLAVDRVDAANASRGALASRLQYEVGDANRGAFGQGCFDIVFAKAALHHVEDLESCLDGVRRCLRPGGRLVTIDFFGPTRFQWTQRQLDAANRFIAEHIPERLRRRADGSLFEVVTRPTVQEMIDMDPSEAVRSGELHALLGRELHLERDLAIGGSLLNLVLDASIVNNFALDDELAMQVIDRAFALERELMRSGEIGCDFRLIVGSTAAAD